MRLQDQVALVTAGGNRDSAGIGHAIALGYAREGAHVGIVDADGAAAERTAEQIRVLGRRALALAADLTRPDEVERVVAAMVVEFGRIEVEVKQIGVLRNPIEV